MARGAGPLRSAPARSTVKRRRSLDTEQLRLAVTPVGGEYQPWLEPAYETPVRRIRLPRGDPQKVRLLVPEDDAFEGELRPYQHDGVTVLYLTPRILLGDGTGFGKTVQLIRLLVYLKSKGELSRHRPAIVVVPAGNAFYSSWLQDGFQKFVPNSLRVAALSGDLPPRERRGIYAYAAAARGVWDVLLFNYQTLLKDASLVAGIRPSIFVLDEGDAIKSHGAQTSQATKVLTSASPRIVLMTATAIQTQLMDLQSQFEGLGLQHLVGTPAAFKRNYYNFNSVQRVLRGETVWTRERDKHMPYKNLGHLQAKIWPHYYRRTPADVPGEMPELQARPVFLPMTTVQGRAYEALRRTSLPDPPPDARGQGRRFVLQARATYLKQAATSLQTYDYTLADESMKLDWLMARLTRDWIDGGLDPEGNPGWPLKIVVYSTWKDTIITLARRLEAEGIGYVVLAGGGAMPPDAQGRRREFPYGSAPRDREPLRQRFFTDPNCRVCIGTTAMAASVNLHAAPVLVNLDLPTNPARVEQIAGRVWRQSSFYKFVQVISLISRGTVEEGTLRILAERQDVIDTMNGDTPSALFGALSVEDLETLVTTDWSHR